MQEVKEDALVHFVSSAKPSPRSLSSPEFGSLAPLPLCP
jgi:hypothetical protein